MTIKNSKLWISICFGLSLCSSSIQGAQDSRFSEALSKLNLTAEQQAKVNQITSSDNSEIVKLKNELKLKQDILDSLLSNDSASDEDINSVKSSIDSLEERLNQVKEHTHLSIKSLLNAEQKKRLRELQFSH